MPPKPKFKREDFIAAALDIIRESSIENITAQSVAKKLNISTRPMFNYFSTLEELRDAAAKQARKLYNSYAEKGLKMTPAFKGFALEYIRFAIDEPSLFRLLFMRKAENTDISSFLNREGHIETILGAAMEIFDLTHDEAMWLYENMWTYAHGLAALSASEMMKFSDEEISERIGTVCRGLVMSLKAPKDERTKIMPKIDTKIPGTVEDYITPV